MEPFPCRARRRAALGLALFTALVTSACGPELQPVTGTVETMTLRSKAVGDDYLIEVRLPPSYIENEDVLYPVVYQLDGTSFGPQFSITAGLASTLEASGRIRDVVVVGIGYPYEDPLTDTSRGRMRDYVIDSSEPRPARGDHFLTFLETELIPYVEARYRADPQERYLSGHSLGGFFALHVMLSRGAEVPKLFAGFIAGDPSLSQDDLLLFREAEALREGGADLASSLFLAIARYDGATQQVLFEELGARLRWDFPDLRMRDVVYDTDHGGVVAPGFEDGLVFLLGSER